MKKNRDLYLPGELLKKYPGTPFSSADLGRLLRLDLLEGVATKRESLIEEKSFLRLIGFRNSVIEAKKIKVDTDLYQ